MVLEPGQTVLFQGDSITDAGRNRQNTDNLGGGYALIATATLKFKHPALDLKVANRGISGNRSLDLLNRWDEDCIHLRPDFLSLFIGINNTWRRYDRNDPTPANVFEAELRTLLDRAFTETTVLPQHTVLLEPFLLDVPEGSKKHWFEDLIPKQEIIARAAKDYGTRLVPLQTLFDEAATRAPAAHWTHDGVHPSPAGHALIAQAWLDSMENILLPNP